MDVRPTFAFPPMPADPVTIHQWEHTRLRRRMLYGLWERDLKARLKKAFGPTRSEAVGDVDLSANPYAATCAATAALYDREARAYNDAGSAVEAAMRALLRRSGHWAQMQRTMRDVLGMREMLVRLDVPEGGDEPTYQPVPVDLVEMVADPEHPEQPIEVKHAVQRETPDGRSTVWTWDVWSLRGEPTHRVLSTTGRDISDQYGLPAGGAVGEAYPSVYRYADGSPFLPFSIYHAARTGTLLDSYHGIEVVEGTLNVGVMWTFFGHCVRNASWPQRVTLNAMPAATSLAGDQDTQRIEVVGDPTAVVQLVSDPDGEGQPIITQWTTSTDPAALAEAIGVYERRLAAFAGLDPSDVRRISGDPRSGYALAISREGRRESQRRYAPIFAPADEELIGKTAAIVNRRLGADIYPETGWRVEYQSLPPSAEERREDREHVFGLMSKGLVTTAEARSMLGMEPMVEQERADEPPPQRMVGEITSVISIVQAVAAGTMPPDSGIAQLRYMLALSDEEARAIIAGSGTTFKAEAK